MENAKRISGIYAAQNLLKGPTDGPIKLGIGSGSTIVHCVAQLAKLYHSKEIDVVCFPTSFQAKQLIVEHKLPISDLDIETDLDIAIDGVDEIDSSFNAIKGGGGCLFREKLIAFSAKTVIGIADISKRSKYLGENWNKGIPIEVFPVAYKLVMNELIKLGLKPHLRMAIAKAGPVVTDHGNFLIDATFDPDSIKNIHELDRDLHMIPGIIETGLFLGIFTKIIFGENDGKVLEIDSLTKEVKCIDLSQALITRDCNTKLSKL